MIYLALMNLQMPGELAERYKHETQRVREVSESWCERNLFCSSCPSLKLKRLPGSSRSADLICPKCDVLYELKAHRNPLGRRIPDGQYTTMMESLRSANRAHFLFMYYKRESWEVIDLMLVPSFLVPPSAIHRRNPSQPKGRAKPWTGCDLLLDRIPLQGRIGVVLRQKPIAASLVRQELVRVNGLKKVNFKNRGWELEVLRVVEKFGRQEFTNQDVYQHEEELAEAFPSNRNIQAKIRQQLQNLRDAGLVEHVDKGRWRLKG